VDKPLFKTILEEKTNNFVSSRTAIPGFIVKGKPFFNNNCGK
jgi:hypothetical protein